MMFTLKPLSKDAVPAAIARAERYRLLNEPWQAESICRDVLAVEPDHQAAMVLLILALTDQFDCGINAKDAMDVVAGLKGEYERAYYSGIVDERRAMALLRQTDYRSGHVVHSLFRHAMEWYEKAESLRPPGNDDSLLRWNTCVRVLRKNPHLGPMQEKEPVVRPD
jgi:hypothetical protein